MAKQDAIALLKADHVAVKKLFAQEEKATGHDGHRKYNGQNKQDILDQIKGALTVRHHRGRNLLSRRQESPFGKGQRRSARGI
jgi:hypothetical protein